MARSEMNFLEKATGNQELKLGLQQQKKCQTICLLIYALLTITCNDTAHTLSFPLMCVYYEENKKKGRMASERLCCLFTMLNDG